MQNILAIKINRRSFNCQSGFNQLIEIIPLVKLTLIYKIMVQFIFIAKKRWINC